MDNKKTNTDNERVLLAVFSIVVAVFTLSFGDAIVKSLVLELSVWQIFVLRSLCVIPILVLLASRQSNLQSYDASSLGWAVVRSVLLVMMWACYYISLPHLDFSVAAAAYYTLPIFIMLMAAIFLNERVSALKWCAVGIGFLGAWLILRPNTEEFSAYALLPLAAAILYATSMIITRARCSAASPFFLSLVLCVVFLIVGGAMIGLNWSISAGALPNDDSSVVWQPLDWNGVWAILTLSGALLVGSVGTAIAYQSAPPSVVTAFDFMYLPFAVFWGFVFFSEFPDLVTLLGICAIAFAGILIVCGTDRSPNRPAQIDSESTGEGF